MKNIIGFSILFSIVLCSCKSNSFLNQRYTNFTHSKTKPSPIATAKKMEAVASSAVTKKPEILNEEVNAILMCDNNVAVKNSNASVQKTKTLHRSINHPIAFAAKQFKTITSKHLQVQKEKKSKAADVYKGVVNKILKIVLVLLILAVVVGIIVIIVLLM